MIDTTKLFWSTRDGSIIPLPDMNYRHVVNCMRMLARWYRWGARQPRIVTEAMIFEAEMKRRGERYTAADAMRDVS